MQSTTDKQQSKSLKKLLAIDSAQIDFLPSTIQYNTVPLRSLREPSCSSGLVCNWLWRMSSRTLKPAANSYRFRCLLSHCFLLLQHVLQHSYLCLGLRQMPEHASVIIIIIIVAFLSRLRSWLQRHHQHITNNAQRVFSFSFFYNLFYFGMCVRLNWLSISFSPHIKKYDWLIVTGNQHHRLQHTSSSSSSSSSPIHTSSSAAAVLSRRKLVCYFQRDCSPHFHHQLSRCTHTTYKTHLSICISHMTEWVYRRWHPTQHIIGHFRDESFQAINWTDMDNQTTTEQYTSNTK